MRSRSSLGVAIPLFLLTMAVPQAQVAKPAGAATPQEAVAVLQKTTAAGQVLQSLSVISPNGLKQIANEGVSGVLMVLAFSDPDDPMPGGPKLSKTELDAKKKQYRAAVDMATQTLKPYGLDTVIGKPALAPETQKTIDAALAKTDNMALVNALYASLLKLAPMLGINEKPQPRPLVKVGTVTGYKINGDKATAQNDANTMDFVRINGRWFIEPPAEPGSGGSGASSAPASSAGASAQAAPKAAAASGKEPEIGVGGLQIVRVTVPDNDFSAKPFHEDNGTSIVLWVKMPAGQGLIEIDEDASVLQKVSDDKGSSLGGKFGSFPEEFKDGTGGTIEIKSSGFAAPGASAILAEGSVAMMVATGTTKTRVAKVQLTNESKFTYLKTPIVVSEVQASDDSQTFTMKLPRSVMAGIKNVVFLDAKGQPLEGSRTSSGYMNDAAEMGFSVKTTAKTITVEFEAWTGQKTIKVPFKVKAVLGLE
jgi:hypothetical protein